ncbi:hypothetical protein SUGI_0794050 [Cryptomeria japonica]|nr:hypothetical protein SUGI_0794050 [Cryptomeria japonica]
MQADLCHSVEGPAHSSIMDLIVAQGYSQEARIGGWNPLPMMNKWPQQLDGCTDCSNFCVIGEFIMSRVYPMAEFTIEFKLRASGKKVTRHIEWTSEHS